MRKNKYLFITIAGILLMVGCEQRSVTEREYPRIHTLPVTEITPSGATFKAEIIFRGDFLITTYGFVWSDVDSPLLSDSDRAILTDNISGDHFSAKVSSTLVMGKTYYVRPFISTEEYTVYGKTVKFTSLGSGGPEVSGFTPLTGSWGDTINVMGINFSYINGANMIRLGDARVIPFSSSDTLLSFAIPPVINSIEVPLSVEIKGNVTPATNKFRYIVPEVFSIAPVEVTYSDTLVVSGRNFNRFPIYNKVLISNINAVIYSATPEMLKVLVPQNLKTRYNSVKIISAGYSLIYSGNIVLKGPQIDSVTPDTIFNPNYIVTIYGKNFSSTPENNTVIIGGYKGSVIEASETRIRVKPSVSLIENYYFSIFKEMNVSVTTAEQTFNYYETIYLSYKSMWTRRKDFPGTARFRAAAFALDGKGYLATGGVFETDEVLSDLWEYDPASDEWTRKNDFPGTGRSGTAFFALGGLGYVGLGSDQAGYSASSYYGDFFRYDPMSDTWDPIEPFPAVARHRSGSFVLGGKAYVGGGDNKENYYTRDVWIFDPAYDQWTETTSFPDVGFPSNIADIEGFTVNGKGYFFNYSDVYRFDETQWTNIPADLALTAWDNLSFTIGDHAFIGMGSPHATGGTSFIWEWNPVTNNVIRHANHYENSRWGAAVFVIGNRAFIIGGVSVNDNGNIYFTRKDVWEFDPKMPENY